MDFDLGPDSWVVGRGPWLVGEKGLEFFGGDVGAAEEVVGGVAVVALADARRLQIVCQVGHGGAFLGEAVDAFFGGEADAGAEGGEALVGVVASEGEAEFGSAGEHAVGFGGGLGDKVVDHDADVGLVACEDESFFILDFEGGVYAGDEALAGGFFVAGGAVELAGEVEAFDQSCFERGVDLMRWGEVVFDGVAPAEDFGVFEAFDAVDDFELDVFGEAGGDAVAVDFVGVEAFGFEEDLVAVFVGEADDFVFDGWAVAWAAGLDLAGVHWRAVEVGFDEGVGFFVGVGDVHGELGKGGGKVEG